MQGTQQQVTGTTPAQNLVGQIGSLVGDGASICTVSASNVPPSQQSVFGIYGPIRDGLMDSRNYNLNQNFLGGQGHACGGCQGCQGMIDLGMQGQGLQEQGLHR